MHFDSVTNFISRASNRQVLDFEKRGYLRREDVKYFVQDILMICEVRLWVSLHVNLAMHVMRYVA